MTEPLDPQEINQLLGQWPVENGDVLFTLPLDSPPVWTKWEVRTKPHVHGVMHFYIGWSPPDGGGWKLAERHD